MDKVDLLKNFISSNNVKLDELLKFTATIDKMTSVIRRTTLLDMSRLENDAEHSWHIAIMALFFKDFAIEKVDVNHAVELLLMHDLVEIYAGDIGILIDRLHGKADGLLHRFTVNSRNT